jgi:hypothetical protein
LNLNAYTHSLLKDETDIYTPSWLKIPAGLCQRFATVLRHAENDVVERGYNLHWLPGSHGPFISIAPPLYEGDYNTVDLASDKVHLEMPYIGDFHIHPYQQRYGDHVAIGPSSGDWRSWHAFFPQHKKCGIFIVASGAQLFLIVFRRKPAVLLEPTNLDAHRLSTLRQGLNKYQNNEFSMALNSGNWARYLALMNHFSPAGAKWHEEDVHKMNCAFAESNGCEYFRGALTANGESYLYLQSKRIMGNWLTARLWTRPSAPWLSSSLF